MDRGAWWAAVHGVAKSRDNWATSLSLFTFMHWRRKWQPTPVILPRESQGQRSLVGCCLWGRKESDTTERLHFHFHFQIPYRSKKRLHRPGLTNWHGTVLSTLLSCWNLPIPLAHGSRCQGGHESACLSNTSALFNPSWETSFSNIGFSNPDFSYKYIFLHRWIVLSALSPFSFFKINLFIFVCVQSSLQCMDFL